jgi:hypothetical protein
MVELFFDPGADIPRAFDCSQAVIKHVLGYSRARLNLDFDDVVFAQ